MFEMLTSFSNLNLSSSGFFFQLTMKILIFAELVFCNNFECELNKLHKMDPSKLGF